MGLQDYRQDMEACCRCSACKFIPLENVTGADRVNVCPGISRYNFHAYSGGGRMGLGVALLDGELGYTDKLLDIVYNCQMCGGCDTSCKYAMDMDVFEPIAETRIACVENGKTLPVFDTMVRALRATGRLEQPGEDVQGAWYDGLGLRDFTKEKTDVVFHAGCRTCADPSLWKVARASARLMQQAGENFGIAEDELCCGGRAYYLGYKDDFLDQARRMAEALAASGARTLVTGCAECYQAFKVLYDRFGLLKDFQVMHTSQYFLQLVREGRLKPAAAVKLEVTYHDPCYLGRLGEPWVHWEGKMRPGQIRLFDPPREFRRGTNGVYEAPRELLAGIPGVTLAEMERRREYAWCCGAGGGVRESNPAFAVWTADERIAEAAATGAKALVTACPGCERIFDEAQSGQNGAMEVLDIVEVLARSVLREADE